MTTESSERCASSKTLLICAAFAASCTPRVVAGAMRRTKGKVDVSAMCAARAVLPAPAAPSNTTERREVRDEARSCWMRTDIVSLRRGSDPPYSRMPCGMQSLSISSGQPKAGCSSASARSKSGRVTSKFSAFAPFLTFSTVTSRPKAHEVADRTSPSISAPEKFFVSAASSSSETSGERYLFSRIFAVCIDRIWCRPCSSGSEISTCTSSRPGRSSAASIMSSRLVMPITRMLLSECTPSILESSWLTTVSPTPASDLCMPRCLQIESISSKMMMCRSESSPRDSYSASASAKSLRTFSSAWPTNLESTSGPLTTLGSLPLSIFPIWRAMSVLPVPGGPCSIMPLTCEMPSFFMTETGKMREAKARRKMSENSWSSPPIPIASNDQSERKMFVFAASSTAAPVSLMGDCDAGRSCSCVCGPSMPLRAPFAVSCPSGITSRLVAVSFRLSPCHSATTG
mmetsp:Transcript_22149/g.70749  ORF Transcript_22149/g.70749 Transcript_22149/m.70749 type:complete len:458 (+) Transcript_22149:614-1987(+)